jgi:hypothetical protein
MRRRDILILAGIVAVAAAVALASGLRGKGAVAIETPGAELVLKNGWFGSTVVTNKAGSVPAQAGIYHPAKASIRLTKEGQDQWWLLSSTRGPWGKLAAVRVDKGQTTTLRFGPPITLHADVQQSGRMVTVGLAMIGQAGEQWSPVVMTTAEGRTATPGVRIVDESGKTLAEGRFAYG